MGKFKNWLEGYLDSVGDGHSLTAKDVAIIRERMQRLSRRGFSDEEVENIKSSTIDINRSPQEWRPIKGSAADVQKMDPTAVSTHKYDENEVVGTYRG